MIYLHSENKRMSRDTAQRVFVVDIDCFLLKSRANPTGGALVV